MTKEEYESLNEEEKARRGPYGMVNVYICPSGHWTVTVDRDYGVTPFMIPCQHQERLASASKRGVQIQCKQLAQSSMYRVPQWPEKATHEFYRPSFEYFQNIQSEALKEHIKNGGLAFRKIGDLDCHQ